MRQAIARARAEAYAAIAAGAQLAPEQLLARYRKMFAERPLLLVPLDDMRISFNPSRMTPLPPLGTVYGTGRMRDVWGHVEVEGDFLIAADRESLRLPGPVTTGADKVSGPGWTPAPAPGWTVRPWDREGSFRACARGPLSVPYCEEESRS